MTWPIAVVVSILILTTGFTIVFIIVFKNVLENPPWNHIEKNYTEENIERNFIGSRVSTETLQEIEKAYQQYKQEIKQSKLEQSTKETYITHSRNFVRWLKKDFEPGNKREDN